MLRACADRTLSRSTLLWTMQPSGTTIAAAATGAASRPLCSPSSLRHAAAVSSSSSRRHKTSSSSGGWFHGRQEFFRMAQRTSPVPRNRRHVASMALTAATPRRNGIHRVPPLLLFGPSCVIGSACLAWWWNVEGGSSYDDDVGGAHVSACEVLAAAGGDGSGGGAVPMKDGDGRWDDDDDDDIATLWAQAKRAMRMVRRLVKLLLVLSPVLALYPLHLALCRGYGGDRGAAAADAQDVVLDSLEHGGVPPGPLGWYYRVCLVCVEWSGAACIKLMQWAGSRPDMFGQDFCAVFSQLQDDTTPHAWKHTERALVEAYGTNWEDRVRLDHILGSGCIAQVYKGTVWGEDGTERPVAVKVMHPNVEEDIDADLDLMRLSVRILEWLDFGPIRNLRWLNLPGIIEEMATMLKIQLDLTTEGEHLVKFNRNFRENEMITFPELVEGFSPTKRVLVETYCPGVPIMDYIRTNRADRSLLSTMCEAAIKAVCQMIFLDNFMHGDLHPGNVLVSVDNKFVLLDVGIVTQHSEADHRLLSDVLAAFIRCDGQKAGRLMIDDSNAKLKSAGDRAIDEDHFTEKIEWLTVKASGKGYLMEHLGTYITYICNAAASHHVMLNPSFVSAALAVKVQEGIALALDPSVEIWRIAIPIILEGERRHGRAAERAQEMFGLDRFVEWWMTGGKTAEQKAMEERKKRAADRGV